jgi:hypothetical protein
MRCGCQDGGRKSCTFLGRVNEYKLLVELGCLLSFGSDENLQAADLFPLHFAIFIEEGVPFSDLEPYRENLPLDETQPI